MATRTKGNGTYWTTPSKNCGTRHHVAIMVNGKRYAATGDNKEQALLLAKNKANNIGSVGWYFRLTRNHKKGNRLYFKDELLSPRELQDAGLVEFVEPVRLMFTEIVERYGCRFEKGKTQAIHDWLSKLPESVLKEIESEGM